jgi:hypothetical protein
MTQQLFAHYNINDNMLLVICIATCLTGAYILHLAIEKPFMHLRERLTRQKLKLNPREDIPTSVAGRATPGIGFHRHQYRREEQLSIQEKHEQKINKDDSII